MEPPSDDLDFGATIRAPAPGRRMFDRYELSRLLGRGGMGVVWLAHDAKLDRDVALKFLPDLVRLDASAIDDLKHETRRSLELTHPNIVRIHDFVDGEHTAAIAMEYVNGATVSTLRVSRPLRVFEPADLEGWIQQLADALDYAHFEVRVVHRDLKPANLMVNAGGQLKMTDFGISRSISDSVSRLSQAGAAAGNSSGTLAYMSPQQAVGQPVTTGDDIYALGATLYELLTSKPPFFSGNLYHQIESVLPPPIAERRRQLDIAGTSPIPESWETTVGACLAKDPTQRPRCAAEIVDRLGLRPTTRLHHRAAAPQPASVLPPPPPPEPPTARETAAPAVPAGERSNRPMLWAIGGGAALLVMVLGAVGLYLTKSSSVPPSTGRGPSLPYAPVEEQAAPDERAKKLQAQSEAQQMIESLAAQPAKADEARLRLRRYLEAYGADAFYNATYARLDQLASDQQTRSRQQELARAQTDLEALLTSDPPRLDEARVGLRTYLANHGRDAFSDAFYARLDRAAREREAAERRQQTAAERSASSPTGTAESSIRLMPTAPPAPASPTLSAQEAGNFIIDNLNALQRQDLRSFVSGYADRVSWFDDGTVGRDYIYRDKLAFFKTWPTLRVSMNEKIRVYDTEQPAVKRAEFTYHFLAANPRTGKIVQGDSANVWMVQKVNGAVSIFSTRETVHNRRSSR